MCLPLRVFQRGGWLQLSLTVLSSETCVATCFEAEPAGHACAAAAQDRELRQRERELQAAIRIQASMPCHRSRADLINAAASIEQKLAGKSIFFPQPVQAHLSQDGVKNVGLLLIRPEATVIQSSSSVLFRTLGSAVVILTETRRDSTPRSRTATRNMIHGRKSPPPEARSSAMHRHRASTNCCLERWAPPSFRGTPAAAATPRCSRTPCLSSSMRS